MKEAEAILPFPFRSHELELDEIQSMDIAYIVRRKALHAFETLQSPLFVDDAGFYVDTWQGYPGPLVKFIHTAGGAELLLRMMKSETKRDATFRAAIGYHDGMNIHVFTGEVQGAVSHELRGTDGWGFDPIFIPESYDKTFAELGSKIKNKLSHRRRALEAFGQHLKKGRE